tara:strand:+ start:12559 stop:13800 length:1242 start_codon:yes stop_codon:yes gene_type:complete
LNNIKKKVYLYTEVVPKNTGSGSQVRVFTNICAYLDLGYEVEVILFKKSPDLPDYFLAYPVIFTVINNLGYKENNIDKIGYFLGWPKNQVLNWLFPIRKNVKIELQKRISFGDNAIHHFEYLNLASSTFGLNGSFIYSNHDLVSDRYLKIEAQRRSLQKKRNLFSIYYKYFQLKRAEKWIAKYHNIILTVSDYDTDLYSKRIKNGVFKLLPWSWPDEIITSRTREWIKDNKIKILHLGSLNSMIPYSSLKFILSDLFTILPSEMLNRIELFIAGNNPDAPYSNKIKNLAKEYENVHILGYVEDLRPLFLECDLQIVGSQFSTGIRTRIIESFIRGLPVISTNAAAVGMYGLEDRKNIFLVNTPVEISDIFSDILSGKEKLGNISYNARLLYKKQYSSKIQAKFLNQYIDQYIN